MRRARKHVLNPGRAALSFEPKMPRETTTCTGQMPLFETRAQPGFGISFPRSLPQNVYFKPILLDMNIESEFLVAFAQRSPRVNSSSKRVSPAKATLISPTRQSGCAARNSRAWPKCPLPMKGTGGRSADSGDGWLLVSTRCPRSCGMKARLDCAWLPQSMNTTG